MEFEFHTVPPGGAFRPRPDRPLFPGVAFPYNADRIHRGGRGGRQAMTIERIISGGQTGADRAALDAAIEAGVEHGGYLPRGRRTEAGPLPEGYRLEELPTGSYPRRTERNVLAADGTVIFSHGPLRGGSRLTRDLARRHGRPWLHVDLEGTPAAAAARTVLDWAGRHRIRVLNVAGSRASEDPRIYIQTREAIRRLLQAAPAGRGAPTAAAEERKA